MPGFYLPRKGAGGHAPIPGGLDAYVVQTTLTGGAASDVAYPAGVNKVKFILCDRAQATSNNTDKNFDIAGGTGSDTVTSVLFVETSDNVGASS